MIQVLLGHSRIETTARYVRVGAHVVAETPSLLDRLLICAPICFRWLTGAVFGVLGGRFSFKPARPAAPLKPAPPKPAKGKRAKSRWPRQLRSWPTSFDNTVPPTGRPTRCLCISIA